MITSQMMNFTNHQLIWVGVAIGWSVFGTISKGADIAVSLSEVLERYRMANGDDAYEQKNSIRISGRMIMQEATSQMTLIKKRPNLKRIVLSTGGRVMAITYDGKEAWIEVSFQSQRVVQDMEEPALSEFIEDDDFDGPLIGELPEGSHLFLLETVQIDGEDHYQVELLDGRSRKLIYLDVSNMRDTRTEIFYPDEPDRLKEAIHFSEHQNFEGIWIATVVEKYVAGRLESTFEIDDVAFNSGIFNEYFTRPDAGTVNE